MDEKEFLKKLISFSEKEPDAERICSEMLSNYGNINSILDSDRIFYPRDIHMREQTAVLIGVVSAINRKCNAEKTVTKYIKGTDHAKKYFENCLRGYIQELIKTVVLDRNFCVLDSKLISYGDRNSVSSVCRQFADIAVMHKDAKYMLIAHNHPSGNPEPSSNDMFYTHKLVKAMGILDITVIDHIIVGKDKSISMKDICDENIFPQVKGYAYK
ncbi:MAG: JAB domain-containing protein [Ruminococcus sp.]|nr:JAB domain-containing protein [Ruminococcus sp.]HAE52688.1 hypothetical protein [Ruminococcus sp.]